jgi:hypothetical protein
MPCGKNALCLGDVGNGHDDHLCMKCACNVVATRIEKVCIACMKGNCHFEAV